MLIFNKYMFVSQTNIELYNTALFKKTAEIYAGGWPGHFLIWLFSAGIAPVSLAITPLNLLEYWLGRLLY